MPWLNACLHSAFTFEEAVTVLNLPENGLTRVVSMAGRELRCLETVLDSAARGMTLSQLINASQEMNVARLRRCRDVLDDRLEQLCTSIVAGRPYDG